MLEWRDLLLAEGGTDRDRGCRVDYNTRGAALGAGLQAAGAGGLQPHSPNEFDFAA